MLLTQRSTPQGMSDFQQMFWSSRSCNRRHYGASLGRPFSAAIQTCDSLHLRSRSIFHCLSVLLLRFVRVFLASIGNRQLHAVHIRHWLSFSAPLAFPIGGNLPASLFCCFPPGRPTRNWIDVIPMATVSRHEPIDLDLFTLNQVVYFAEQQHAELKSSLAVFVPRNLEMRIPVVAFTEQTSMPVPSVCDIL